MSVPHELEANARKFEHFVKRFDTTESGIEVQDVYLTQLLGGWLVKGGGVAATAENYEYFMETALVIADYAMKGYISLNYEGPPEEPYRRRLSGIYEPQSSEFYDRRAYDMLAYEQRHGTSPETGS